MLMRIEELEIPREILGDCIDIMEFRFVSSAALLGRVAL